MNLQLLSDLHLEANPDFHAHPHPGADLLVLAGDIGSYQTRRDGSVMDEPDWGLRRFSPLPQYAGWPVPVLFVPGNHEYDARDVDETHAELRRTCERLGIQWLEQETLVIDGVRLIGTTLWSDYDALVDIVAPTLPAARGSLPPEGAGPSLGRPGGGSVAPTLPAARGSLPPEGAGPSLGRPGGGSVAPTLPAARGSAGSKSMTHRLRQREKAFRAANFYLSKMDSLRQGRLFDAEAMRAMGLACQAWLGAVLDVPFDGPTVVVTHFAPTLHSADPRYGLSPGTAGFCNALDHLLAKADLWLHGHLHCPQDLQVGRCRIVANPLGYASKGEQLGFQPAQLIQVPKRST